MRFLRLSEGDRVAQQQAELLQLSLKAKTTPWEMDDGVQTKHVDYFFQYENLSAKTTFLNVRLEYCTYRDRIIAGDRFVESDTYSKHIGQIAPRKREEILFKGGTVP